MPNQTEFGNFAFDLPRSMSNVIKVIGVGGGGSNAINHMFRQGIKGVDFVVCNTDMQALQNSPVPHKIQLGLNLTEGLGAGANPEVGQQAALESVAELEKMLDSSTKMVFITAGMGGGTGTGAAPVIAQLAKERDILTVGIVTIPFMFEGKVRYEQAMNGVDRLRKQVDSLIVINNNKLRDVYGNLGFKAGFSKADEVLATASRGIAEVITNHYTQNIDLKDAKTVLTNSGTAIMGSATALGENRAKEAIVAALDSPLLNDNKISGAKNVLLLIVSGTQEITIDEIGDINDHIQQEAGHNANIIMGVGEDETLGESIAVTIIATGFNSEQQHEIVNTAPKKIIHPLEDEQRMERQLLQKEPTKPFFEAQAPVLPVEDKVVFNLVTPDETLPSQPINENELIPMNAFIRNLDVTFEIVSPEASFELTLPETQAKSIEVVDAQWIRPEAPVAMPLETPAAALDLPAVDQAAINNIEVYQPVQMVPVTELNENGVVRYSLEAYMELEQELMQSKPAQPVAKVEEPELMVTLKTVETPVAETATAAMLDNERSPMDMTLAETQRLQADERRRKLKEFNYKFHTQTDKIDELERVPAYKRRGDDLTQMPHSGAQSRLSLGFDSNDDVQLRSNNSFLHDNVD